MQPLLRVAGEGKRWAWIGRWPGGRVRKDLEGTVSFVLERMRGGVRYTHVLFVGGESDAMAELALFERNPARYIPPHKLLQSSPAGAATIDETSMGDFLAAKTEEGTSLEYRRELRASLAKWGAVLRGRDLRALTLSELKAALKTKKLAGGRKHHIIHLKSFSAWLRDEDRLRPSEDPTTELRAPAPRAEKLRHRKRHELEHVALVYAELGSQAVRDVICLRAKTGMHGREIARLARGECELRELNDECGIRGTVRFVHKRRKEHILSLDSQGYEAARRLLERKKAPIDHTVISVLDSAVRRLNRRAKEKGSSQIDRLHPSWLRHSFVTWAKRHGREVKPSKAGVALDVIRQIVGHVTDDTTTTYYDGTEVPSMVRLPLKLVHAGDPPLPTPPSSGTPSKRRSLPRGPRG